MRTRLVAAALLSAVAFVLSKPVVGSGFRRFPQKPANPVVEETGSDEYTRYELLAPETAQFRIIYDVTATDAGSSVFFNAIRKGSEASDEAVYDRMTGRRLEVDVVGGADAQKAGLRGADPDTSYIRVSLPRKVPQGGEVRLRIVKTYKDAKSYFREGDLIVFSRSLGIKRNAVVLPSLYELVACNYPSQVRTEADGRVAVSFINVGPAAVPFVVKGRKLGGR